jgi:hypothetical protein
MKTSFKLALAIVVALGIHSAAFGAAPTAQEKTDASNINSACFHDAQAAGCAGEVVGKGLLKCLHSYKEANKSFKLSPGCQSAISQFNNDKKAEVVGTNSALVSVNLETPAQLRAVVGIPGMRADIRSPHAEFYWDDDSNASGDGASVIQPANFSGSGRWQRDGVSPREKYDASPDADSGESKMPSVCTDGNLSKLVLRPSDSSDDVVKELNVAIAKAGETGCPVHVPAGIYTISNREIKIAADHVTIYCEPGAVFKKTGDANLFWFRGAFDRMLGRCEIDGNGFGGSGLIVDASAQDAQLSGVYSHNNLGHGILNTGHRTHAKDCRTENNGKVGFANSRSLGTVVKSLLSRWNGNEGLTIDNPGTSSIRVLGGYMEGNCQKGGVGNIGIDAASDVEITGIIATTPNRACPWNLTAQNNVGNTERLQIRGGYFSGAQAGDIHFRTNTKDGFTVTGSSIEGVIATSSANPILIDQGASNNSVKTDNYSGRYQFVGDQER